ncbi:hypothetical protein MHK_003550, partial [Candidatus Magnetomorum sp. HK-1]
ISGSMLMKSTCIMTDSEKDAFDSQVEKRIATSSESISKLRMQVTEASKKGFPLCSVCHDD